MSTTVGSVTLAYADGTSEVITRVNVRANAAAYDRRMFRSPYGEAWLVAGTGKREPEQFTLSFEVWADTIEDAAPLVTELLAKLAAAVVISAPAGWFVSAGVMSYSQSPMEAGYRLDVTMLTLSGRESSSGVTAVDAYTVSTAATVQDEQWDRATMRYLTFTSSGWVMVHTLPLTNIYSPSGVAVVGGGGGGGSYQGGGGGAGGMTSGNMTLQVGLYVVTVGNGGAGGPAGGSSGGSGTTSAFAGPGYSATATGGGGGGANAVPGVAGGSGGGAGAEGGMGGAGTQGLGSMGGSSFPSEFGGGGGGKSAVGGAGGASTGGAGGAGALWDLDYGTYFAGGGGAGGTTGGSGGTGGGGAGATGAGDATAGTDGRGGGGGGSGTSTGVPGAKGGSGVVVLRYRRPIA